jgi:hypothetical protein
MHVHGVFPLDPLLDPCNLFIDPYNLFIHPCILYIVHRFMLLILYSILVIFSLCAMLLTSRRSLAIYVCMSVSLCV